MSEQIWYKEPAVLFAPDTWSRFVPTKDMTTTEALNSVVRFSTYFSVLLFVSTGVSGYMMAVPIVMVATILLHSIFPNGKTIETFIAQKKEGGKYTMPTAENPFMNPLLTEITDDPNRPDAAPITRRDVKVEMYKAFQKTSDLYMDTTDLFDQTQAMRTFSTLQSATIPNDLDGFKAWLSKNLDEPDYSSNAPARNAKILNEGYVAAKGSNQHKHNEKHHTKTHLKPEHHHTQTHLKPEHHHTQTHLKPEHHHTQTHLKPEHHHTQTHLIPVHLSGESMHLPNTTAKPSGTTPAKATTSK